jgi:4-aminobutyrate aminotransferase
MSMSSNDTWLERDRAAKSGVLPVYFDIFAASGEGSWLTDVDGRRFLDMTSGIAVTSVGHCNPAVVEAIERQARKLLHTSVVTRNTETVEVAEQLQRAARYFNHPQVFFCNSGAEAVDGALKLARMVTKKPGIIAFRRAFHGRTLGATSLTTANGKYRSGYEPLLPSVHIAPYCMDGDHEAALAQLDEILSLQAPETNIGAMIVEPVLGEGGYIVPPVEWLQGLRERCDRHGILLVFDEVQAGIGRTGKMFAAETFGVTPDVTLFAKGVANGLPLGGIIAPKALMDQWPNGAHGTTFGGNPVSCAAAKATLNIINNADFLQSVVEKGERALSTLRAVDSAAVKDVRGIGLMIGIEVVDGAIADRVQQHCFDHGVLILICGAEHNVIRLVPSLTISDDELQQGLDVLIGALRSA